MGESSGRKWTEPGLTLCEFHMVYPCGADLRAGIQNACCEGGRTTFRLHFTSGSKVEAKAETLRWGI